MTDQSERYGDRPAGSEVGSFAPAGRPRFVRPWSDARGAASVVELFRRTFAVDPDGVWAAPGRVNLIGEHLDYNGGLCLPMALPQRTFVALRRRDDDVVRLVSALDPGQVWTGTVADVRPGGVSGFVAYATGPHWALREGGARLGGFDVADASCVPLAAGLSSSAAIEAAVAVALDAVHGLGLAATDAGRSALAAACVLGENEVAGAPTGGMDQAAALRSSAGHALLLDCLDSSVRLVPFDLAAARLALLVIDTRAPHSLVDGQYAARRDSCHRAAERLGVASLREVSDLDGALAALDDPVQRARVRHVVTEIERVRRFVALVGAGRFGELGPVLNASHESLRVDFEVSCAELDLAVSAARCAGALGARMTGGGFGGSAIALVKTGTQAAVARAVSEAFAEHAMVPPAFLVAVAAAPAGPVDASLTGALARP